MADKIKAVRRENKERPTGLQKLLEIYLVQPYESSDYTVG